ncbi:leucine-rich repeat extensin-like protein 5 [Zea mays]|nr:leucine-rich repeat extensin-like protein 5 [Zea mays]|eukprot:XP_020402091.1 leucine-rich repeat extensin-like protein 5 [Zea mays]
MEPSSPRILAAVFVPKFSPRILALPHRTFGVSTTITAVASPCPRNHRGGQIHYLAFLPGDVLFIAHHLATLFVFLTCCHLVRHSAYALLVLAEVTSLLQNAGRSPGSSGTSPPPRPASTAPSRRPSTRSTRSSGASPARSSSSRWPPSTCPARPSTPSRGGCGSPGSWLSAPPLRSATCGFGTSGRSSSGNGSSRPLPSQRKTHRPPPPSRVPRSRRTRSTSSCRSWPVAHPGAYAREATHLGRFGARRRYRPLPPIHLSCQPARLPLPRASGGLPPPTGEEDAHQVRNQEQPGQGPHLPLAQPMDPV